MKKIFIHIILSLLILFSNSGWAISFHYCHNKLTSVTLQYSETDIEEGCIDMDSCCGDDEEAEDDMSNDDEGCCKKSTVTSSTSDSVDVVKLFSLHLPIFVLSGESFVLLNADIVPAAAKESVTPIYYGSGGLPLYALYCQRVFYA